MRYSSLIQDTDPDTGKLTATLYRHRARLELKVLVKGQTERPTDLRYSSLIQDTDPDTGKLTTTLYRKVMLILKVWVIG